MDRLKTILDTVNNVNLLEHPFYQEWSMGTLPVEKLGLYAQEYGRFINLVAKGWETLGDTAISEEEKDHARMWGEFKQALPVPTVSDLPQTNVLVASAKNLFNAKPEALGALYAFEAQQPATSASKLEGLQKHYNVGEAAEEYFLVHADDQTEPAILAERIANLPEYEYQRALGACRVMASALWSALDGIYYA